MVGPNQFSPSVWTSLLRILPNELRIRIGLKIAMVSLLDGMVQTIQKSTIKSPSGRRQKRRYQDESGIGVLPVSSLELDASSNGDFHHAHGGNLDAEANQEYLCDCIVSNLALYRDTETPAKAAEKPLKILRIFQMKQGSMRAQDVAPQLCEVAGKLYFGSVRWRLEDMDDEKTRM